MTNVARTRKDAGEPGTEPVRSGADLRTVQTLLRHASLATTQIYTKIGEDQRAKAISGLPDLDGG